MKSFLTLFFIALFFMATAYAETGIRTIYIKEKESAIVRTSPGFSTIVEVPDPIRYFIAGNQEAFKIEFVENRLAIKPLVYEGKTNLHVSTEKDFFYLTLLVVEPDRVDYIVRIEKAPTSIKIAKEIIQNNVILKIDTITESEKFFNLYFSLTNKGENTLKIIPEKISISQKSQIPIKRIIIPKKVLPPNETLKGRVVFLKIKLTPTIFFIPFENTQKISISFLGSQ